MIDLPPDVLASAMTDRVHRDVGRGRPLVPERVLRRHVDLTSIALAYLARPVSPVWPGVR